MRRLLCLIALVCQSSWQLAACDGPQARAPATASRIPAGLPVRAYPPEGWAWGLIGLDGAPPIRYGVASPPVVPRGQVLILPGYGEPAEAWFEAIDDLVGRGYGVWLLEGAGQGGSGRSVLPRDVGHAPDFQTDIDALKAMRAVMGRRPAVVIAQGTAAPVLIAALRAGLPVQGAILSAPVLSPDIEGPYGDQILQAAPWLVQARLGGLRAFDQSSWRAQTPLPAGRAGVIQAWQTANPPLRMAGASWGWIAAFADQTDATKAGSLSGVRAPVLILHPGPAPSSDASRLCRRLPRCTLTAIPAGRGSLHLESDAAFKAWTEAVAGFVAQANDLRGGV